ncbi:MAG: hypothetical protein WKF77_13145 [Planctomycetaceae bacterium]
MSVNNLREVCGHIRRKLSRLPPEGSVQIEGNAEFACLNFL